MKLQKRVQAGLAATFVAAAMTLPAQAQNVDWRLHNLDLAGGRYADLDQITPENVAGLTPRWLFQHGVIDGVSNQTTPVIVDGIMYVTDARGSVYAVDAADGHLLWTYNVTELLGGARREGYIFRHRGVTYENGVVYSAAGSFIFALDAQTGEPLEGFGENGQASVILDVLRLRYPEVETAISMGYWFTTAPQIHDGVIYVGSTRSESFIPGGHVLAVDALSGEVLWHFNTIPQDESDQGWDIAGPTWVGGVRNGGGIWETPSIDPELGLVYVAVGNPFGDSTRRAGMNLFTDSVIALSLDEGRLAWYYQLVHHDVWDYDNGSQPILFDMEVDGEPVKALAQANKNSWLYILDRRTGEPIHPIIETPVPTETDTPGEQPWPTQPIPHKANGERMEPVSPVVPTDIPPEDLEGKRIVTRVMREERLIDARRVAQPTAYRDAGVYENSRKVSEGWSSDSLVEVPPESLEDFVAGLVGDAEEGSGGDVTPGDRRPAACPAEGSALGPELVEGAVDDVRAGGRVVVAGVAGQRAGEPGGALEDLTGPLPALLAGVDGALPERLPGGAVRGCLVLERLLGAGLEGGGDVAHGGAHVRAGVAEAPEGVADGGVVILDLDFHEGREAQSPLSLKSSGSSPRLVSS